MVSEKVAKREAAKILLYKYMYCIAFSPVLSELGTGKVRHVLRESRSVATYATQRGNIFGPVILEVGTTKKVL